MESLLICDICSQSLWKKISKRLMQCTVCGLTRAIMNPTDDELQRVYQHDYFFGGEYADYFQDRSALEKNFASRVKRIKNFLPPQGTLIEIGCSYGFFLNLCKDIVGKSIGYDITKEGIEYARQNFGLEVHCDSFLNYTGEPVDMICMWDVIEHLPRVDEILGKIAISTKKGGFLALTTGDIGSPLARMRGDRWRMVHPPTHLFYFDKSSITKLLAKHGFEIVSYRHTIFFRNVDSVFQQLLYRTKNKKIPNHILKFGHGVCKKIGLTRFNFGINLYDIMDVVAIKKR